MSDQAANTKIEIFKKIGENILLSVLFTGPWLRDFYQTCNEYGPHGEPPSNPDLIDTLGILWWLPRLAPPALCSGKTNEADVVVWHSEECLQ